ncbi:CRISPR-associated protein Cmr6 [Seinonella peptonophila]|uniref:CRISPR-associated protein Cmr6 n=1 Tax=Seinonella peptonophila TaxID=112248 RepID=A0A1M5BM06_9BACL|nr:type III-B CRISPR module RAMP protein Cmr6 [Seinonella peptonophila]SHF43643.1 CRISPR-associated protein Cmr6 [Seinonella peptonophila]
MSQLPLYKEMEPIDDIKSGNQGLVFNKWMDQWKLDWDIDKKNWLNRWHDKRVGERREIQAYLSRMSKLISGKGAEITIRTKERMVIGMGLPHPVENGFAWHHTLGVPYIPGSSIKGMLRATLRRWSATHEGLDKIFGSREEQEAKQVGSILFYDAIPSKPIKLEVDIMTPHYTTYYGNPSIPPQDQSEPIPIPFLTIAKNQDFQLFFMSRTNAPQMQADLKVLKQWIRFAGDVEGIGAKTNIGYGQFQVVDDTDRH